MATEHEVFGAALEHVAVSHAALDKAQAGLAKAAAEKTAAAAEIPAVVEALVRHGRILPESREKAASMLADHAEALKVLARTADPAYGVKAASMGRPAAASPSASGGNPVTDRNYSDKIKIAAAPADLRPGESPADAGFRRHFLGSGQG